MTARAVGFVWAVLIAACGADPTEPAAPGNGPGSSQLAKESALFMADFLVHGDRVYAIIRESRGDCDVAARNLEPLAPAFLELAKRMMQFKAALKASPEDERARIEADGDAAFAAFKRRNPDADALDETARNCDRTSAAFAAVVPRVMTRQRHSSP